MDKPDYEHGLDALQADMAGHQRQFRGEVTAEKNRALAVDAIQQLEKHQADQKPAAPAPMQQQPIKTTREVKDVGGKSYLVKKEQDTTLLRKATPQEQWFLERAMPRIMLLLTKHDTGPLGAASWRDRVLAAMSIQSHAADLRAAAEDPTEFARQKRGVEALDPIARDGLLKTLGIAGISELTPAFAKAKAAELDRKYLAALCDVLEASSAVFGDWKRAPEKKIQVGA